jgi:Ger(x)C family germination protein
MKQNKILLLIILTITLSLSGCWDTKELDELMIPFLTSFDLAEPHEKEYPDDRYVIGVSYPVFYGDVKEENDVAVAAGYLIGETRSRRNAHVGEQLVTGQTKVLLIGNELAEKGNIDEVLDILTRDPSTKASLYLAIVDGRAVDILNGKVNHYPNSDEYVRKLLKHINKTNFYPYISLFHYNREVFSNNIAPLVPYITYKNGDIVLAGSCYIDNGKKIAHLGREETETAVMLRGISCRGTLSFPIKDGDKIVDGISLACTNDRKVRVKNEGEYYSIDITIKLKGGIVERSKQVAFEDSKEIIKLGEKSLEDIIQKRAEALVKKTQTEIKCDTLGVANHIKAITRWELTKEDIDEIIQNAHINVDVEVHILSTEGKM